jgi:hypothetical protein
VLPNITIFGAVFVISMAFFAWSCFNRFRLVTLGKPANRFDNLGRRIWNMISYPFAQRCSVTGRYRFGLNHAVLFWSFMILLIANTEFLLHGLFPDYISLSRLPDGAYHTLAFIFDIVSILVLLTVSIAVVRRLAFPPPYIEARSRDAFTILGLVATLMIAFFGLHASEIARGTEEATRYMPVSSLAASNLFSGASPQSLVVSAGIFWWIHAVVLLFFLNYLPYSKHMHILTSIPNCFFKSLAKVNTQPREDLERSSKRIKSSGWKG